MAEGIVLGLDAVTAINTGTTVTPVYSIVTNVRDETLNLDTSLADVTNREAEGWRLQLATLTEASVDFQMVYKAGIGHVNFEYIRDAFFGKYRILMGFFDDDPAAAATTVNGLIGGFSVTNWTVGRELEEAMMVDVTCTAREDDAGGPPQWITIPNP